MAILSWVSDTCFDVSDRLRPIEHHDVEYHEYKHSHVADINLKVANTMDNYWSIGEYCYCRYWAYVLVRHYLTTGRKYAPIKKYSLNMHVCLLTRLDGNVADSTICMGREWKNEV